MLVACKTRKHQGGWPEDESGVELGAVEGPHQSSTIANNDTTRTINVERKARDATAKRDY